jgi:hypothetical protein
MKPEIIDLDVETAGGASCPSGSSNYSTGCTNGFGNEVNCNTGNWVSTAAGCYTLGYGARKNCAFGWGVHP